MTREKVKSTPFSDFIKHASASEKEKVFNQVITETIVEQNKLLDQAKRKQRDNSNG